MGAVSLPTYSSYTTGKARSIHTNIDGLWTVTVVNSPATLWFPDVVRVVLKRISEDREVWFELLDVETPSRIQGSPVFRVPSIQLKGVMPRRNYLLYAELIGNLLWGGFLARVVAAEDLSTANLDLG